MSLAEREEYRQIAQEVLREILPQELEQFVKKQEERAGQASLMERMVRVEEALLAQGKVLESLQREMDKRFEAMQREMDKRFEAMDKRFSTVLWTIGLGFSLVMGFMALLKFAFV